MLTRAKYGNTCYTCDTKNLSGSNWHTGHLLAKASLGAYLKYDLRVLRPQCGVCNLFRGGMGAEFLRRIIIHDGQEYVDQIFKDRNLIVKAYDHYFMLTEKYKIMLEDLHQTQEN